MATWLVKNPVGDDKQSPGVNLERDLKHVIQEIGHTLNCAQDEMYPTGSCLAATINAMFGKDVPMDGPGTQGDTACPSDLFHDLMARLGRVQDVATEVFRLACENRQLAIALSKQLLDGEQARPVSCSRDKVRGEG